MYFINIAICNALFFDKTKDDPHFLFLFFAKRNLTFYFQTFMFNSS